jgi:nicotinamide-nucleotide amidase
VSARAGIVVTGTEVLTGRVVDRNGPWLADRLLELGVELAHNVIVGDRPADVEAALGWLASHGVDLIVTSGGLGPTEDDLTAEVVGRFQGREMVLDEAMEEKIAAILRPLAARWPDLDMDAIRASNRKQAVVPRGATVLDPVGTAPGLVVPPLESDPGRPTIVVLPGPPRELQPMWRTAAATAAFRAAIAGAVHYETAMLRLFGIPESEIAETLRRAREAGVDIDALEITTCLRRGEVEVVTRYEPEQAALYSAFEAIVRERHADTLFSDDGRSVDEQVADLLRSRGLTIATAESCTGGLLAARITDVAGASSYFPGGVVVYDRAAKEELGVSAATLDAHGEVSAQTALELAARVRERRGADVGVGITGIAGPEGGTAEKPVGLVCFSVVGPDGSLTRSANLPGGRFDVRDRSTTVALHMVRRLLLGEHDTE